MDSEKEKVLELINKELNGHTYHTVLFKEIFDRNEIIRNYYNKRLKEHGAVDAPGNTSAWGVILGLVRKDMTERKSKKTQSAKTGWETKKSLKENEELYLEVKKIISENVHTIKPDGKKMTYLDVYNKFPQVQELYKDRFKRFTNPQEKIDTITRQMVKDRNSYLKLQERKEMVEFILREKEKNNSTIETIYNANPKIKEYYLSRMTKEAKAGKTDKQIDGYIIRMIVQNDFTWHQSLNKRAKIEEEEDFLEKEEEEKNDWQRFLEKEDGEDDIETIGKPLSDFEDFDHIDKEFFKEEESLCVIS